MGIWALGLFLKAMKSLQMKYCQTENRLKCVIVYYYTFKWIFKMWSYFWKWKWLLAFLSPLAWCVFLIWVSQPLPLGSDAQSLHGWPIYSHRIRPAGWMREVDTPVLSHLVPCALLPHSQLSWLINHSLTFMVPLFLERGGGDGDQKQHNIDLKTHSDSRCLQN